MEKEEKYLKSRVETLLEELKAMDKELISRRSNISDLMAKVKASKTEKTSASDFKKELSSIQESHYMAFLLEQSIGKKMSGLKELLVMSEGIKSDLDLADEDKEITNAVKEMAKELFLVDKGKVSIFDDKLYEVLTGGIKQEAESEKALELIYNQIS
jgi:hypothetical protein